MTMYFVAKCISPEKVNKHIISSSLYEVKLRLSKMVKSFFYRNVTDIDILYIIIIIIITVIKLIDNMVLLLEYTLKLEGQCKFSRYEYRPLSYRDQTI